MGKKIIINENKLRAIVRNILIEQVVDLETAIKEMGFVKTKPGNYKHNKDSKLTISIVGDNVIVKKGNKELGKVTKNDIEDLEGIVKSSFPLVSEQVVKGVGSDPYDYKKENGVYYAKKKSSQSWIKATGNAEKAIASKIFKDSVKRPTTQTATDSTKKNVVPTNVLVSDPYDYKKENGVYYAKKKGSQSWIKATGKAEKAIASKIFKDSVKRPTTQTATDSTKKNVVPKKGPTNVLVSDTLVNKKIVFDPSNETTPFKCSEEGCAEWVSNQLSNLGVQRQGNAWHSHNINQKSLEKSPFLKLSPNIQNQMAVLFSTINANPKEKSQESNAKRLVNTLIPQQQSFKNLLSVNDIVGLYYDDSTNFTKAFFEGATGMSDMGNGSKITDGPYFRRADNGKPWSSKDLGQKIKFVPGNSLKNGSGFGLNTHLGYVGAKVDGEPIIFHNVHGQVYATPLSKMGDTKVLWVKSGPGEVIKPKETAPSYWESFTSLFS